MGSAKVYGAHCAMRIPETCGQRFRIADAFMNRSVHNAYIVPLGSIVSMTEIMAQKRMKAIEMLSQEGVV